MTAPEELSVRLSDTTRIEAFSDGVLAIAITLLVIEVRPPVHDSGRLLTALLAQWPAYLGYLTSFLYIAVIWVNHHAAFRRIRFIDKGLNWANLGILISAAFLPFPTAVLSTTLQRPDVADARTAVALYALVAAVMCVSWLVFFCYLGRRPHLVEDDVEDGFFRKERVRAWVGVVLYACGGALGYLVSPVTSLLVFLALPVFYALTSEGLTDLRDPRRRSRVS
ncbi:MAG: TMEM175 family protein [Egibacteraceae bacterium]